MNHKNIIFLACITPLLASILVSCLSSDSVSAHTATITTSSSISLDALPQHDGVAIDEESINVTTTCHSGYNLSIATSTSPNLYLNGDGTGTATFTAVDGTSTLANSTNQWGYSLTTDASSSTIFSPLSTTASVLKTPSQTASQTDIDDTFSIYYGTKVAESVTPGSYQMADNGAIVYYLTMEPSCTQYTIVYNANGGTGTISNQDIEAETPTKLSSIDALTAPVGASYTDANNNTITGNADKLWTFWGWNTQADGTGDWYKDEEKVEGLTSVGSTITLYAQWKQATLADMTASTPSGTEKVINHNEMQDMRPEVCYNSPITTAANAPAATLLDYRGKVTTGATPESPESYTVSKLPDGLCWMTKNLNLGRVSGGANNDGTITLTSDDTDLEPNTTFTLPAGDTTSYTASTRLPKVRLTNNSDTTANGAYYTWSAAVANTTSTSTNPTTSICAKNWDLPISVQYTNLKTRANYRTGNLTTSAPSSFLINGGFTNGSNFYQTSYSHFWTSTSYDSSRAFGARVNNANITTSSSAGTTLGGNKYYRKNLRCVASQGTATINYEGNGTTEYPVTGSVATQTNVEIASTNTQQGTGFSRIKWGFVNWNTAPDGTGITIEADTPLATLNLKPGDTITLYAQWAPQYTITYVNNCMSYASTNASCTQSVSDGTSTQSINLANLPSTGTETGTLAAYNEWTLTGWKIKGWSIAADNTSDANTEYRVGTTYTIPSGSDIGDGITLYAHWVPVYSIQYNGNDANNPNGMGTTNEATGVKSVRQFNVGEGDPVTLLASNFKKAGNGFAGWSTDPDAWTHFTDNDNTNNPIIYGPMETIIAPSRTSSIMTLYAVWVPAEKDGNNSPIYLQEWDNPADTTDGCAALTSATFNDATGTISASKNGIIALTDKRDDEVYTIAKLADNNCWMVENLRLEHTGTIGNNKHNGNVTNQSLSQDYGGTPGTYGSFVGLATPETANYSNSTTANTIYKSDGSNDTYNSANNILEDIGTSNYPGYRFPRYNSDNTQSYIDSPSFTQNYNDASSPINNPNSKYYSTQSLYSFGNYYTWAAAMANTNYYASPSASETANTSICPSGWHLPSSKGTAKEFDTLSKDYGGSGGSQDDSDGGDIMSNRFRSFPNNFIYSGYFYNSAADLRGSSGRYWSRSAYSDTSSYTLRLSSSSLHPSYYNEKYNAFNVRCLIGS